MADAKIEIFFSPTCPHCPNALRVAKELSKEREDFKIVETNTWTEKGKRRAEHYNIRSVPTLFITGSGYPERIGYIGAPSKEKLNKMLNIATGKEEWIEHEGFFSRLAKKLKIKL